MKKVSYIIAAISLIFFVYFANKKIKRYRAYTIEKDKFIADIKAGRKSYDETNWMSPLSVRENDKERLLKDTVIELMSGKAIPLVKLLDTSNVFLHYGSISNKNELTEIEQFYQKYQGKIRFLILCTTNLATTRNFAQKNDFSMPFYIFKNNRFPADIEVLPVNHLITNRKTAIYYAGTGYFDNRDFFQFVDKALAN
ncbi:MULTISPECIES: hypothetical protein [Emticicia]|uniref:hypothetical protein n=1 Tax=Emticicia TaxID=312278 RepID=UPI0012E7449D|nr:MULTISPECIES: hypothetical protein [Emticicia]